MDKDQLQQQIRAAQIDQVYQSATVAHPTTILVALMTTFTLWDRLPASLLLTWGVAMVLVTAVRWYIARCYQRTGNLKPVDYWARWYRHGSMVSGLLIGISAGFMLLNHDPIQHFVLLLISVGMIAGGVTTLSPCLKIFRRFFFSVTIPYAAILFYEGLVATAHGQLMFNLGLMYVAFSIALYIFAITANRHLLKGMYHRFENEQLADHLRIEAGLREEMQDELLLAERIIANVKEGIIVSDHENRIIRINDTFSRITGYEKEDALGKGPALLSSGKQDKQFYISMWESLTAFNEWEGEIWNRRKNGEVYPEWLSISVIRDAQGNVSNYVGWFRDITERKREEERLAYLANYDVLTGLANRKMFVDKLDNELADCKEREALFALMFIDLNLFKSVNDNFGHDVGDVVLKQVAMRIKSVTRNEDIVARMGGDEFVILLRDLTDSSDATRVADKLIETIDTPFYINQHECQVGFAIGISLAPEHGVDRRELLHYADRAMYKAKQDRSHSSWMMSQGGE